MMLIGILLQLPLIVGIMKILVTKIHTGPCIMGILSIRASYARQDGMFLRLKIGESLAILIGLLMIFHQKYMVMNLWNLAQVIGLVVWELIRLGLQHYLVVIVEDMVVHLVELG